MTTVALDAFPQYSTNGGLPLAGGKIYSYQAGTSTPLATYTDRSGSVSNANPVVLDAAGRADVWLSVNVAYKLVLEDSAGNVLDSIDDYYAGADPAQLTAAGIVPSTGGTYTGLVSFTGGATFDGTAAQDLATLDSLNIASVETANLWANSDMQIWQRATASVADGVYGFDRVVNLCDTGSTTLSQLSQPADGIPYAMRITQPDAAPKRFGFCQIVEAKNCIAYRGKNLAFALKVRCSASTTIRCALVAWTSTADSPTRDVVNNWASTTYTAGNFFVANTSTIAVAATSATAGTWTDLVVSSTSPGGVVVPSTMNNLYMVVWTDSTQAQNVTLDASVVRCGQGTVAPLWTPPNAAVELFKCKRYYYRNTSTAQGLVAIGLAISATRAAFFITFPSAMRVTPTLSSANLAPTNGIGGTIAPTASLLALPASDSLLVQIDVAAGLTAGQASLLYAGTGAGGYIAFEAEL
jgi:hypothetical protein